MLSKNMARCIAKISGDGNLYYRYVRYSNTCKELREEFKQDIINEFGKITLTEGIGNSGTSFVQVNRQFVIKKFLQYLPDYRSDFIFVPEEIKNSNIEIIKEYIRAFYDDEGSPSLRLTKGGIEWKRSISLTSNSLRMLNEVKKLLFTNFRIFTNKIIRTNSNNQDDRSFVLNITGKENFIKFKHYIGFKHPIKIARLDLIIRSYSATPKRNRKEFLRLKEELLKLRRQLSLLPARSQYNKER